MSIMDERFEEYQWLKSQGYSDRKIATQFFYMSEQQLAKHKSHWRKKGLLPPVIKSNNHQERYEFYIQHKDSLSKAEIARRLNISPENLNNSIRLSLGIGKYGKLSEVIPPPVDDTIHSKYGVTEEELKAAEGLGLNKTIIMYRIREMNWTKEEAISIPKIPREFRHLKHGGAVDA